MLNYLSKFLYVISAKRSSLLLLISLFLLTSMLDALGIGLIGPFIGLATNPKLISHNSWLDWVYIQSGLKSTTQFIALIGLAIIVTFYIKSVLYFQVQRYVYEFSFTQQAKLRLRLMHAYLTVPYAFHLTKNSALLIQNLVNETQVFAYSIALPLLNTAANFVVLVALVLLLANTDLAATISVSVILLFTFFLYYQFKDKMSASGKEASEANTEMIRIINHSLGGLKETRVIGCEPYFEAQIGREVQRFSIAASIAHVFQILPRIALESLLVTFVVGFTSISLFFNQSPQNLISVLGIFAVASIRLMPSASQFMSSVATLRHSSYSLDKLYLDLKELELAQIEMRKGLELSHSSTSGSLLKLGYRENQAMPFVEQIVLDRVTYRYPTSSEIALKDISLTIKKGQSIALIGKSGAGKTTLVDVILGLLMPESGDIKVDGASVYRGIRFWQDLIGYIPQSIFLIDDTIERNIAFGVPDDLIDIQRLEKAIQTAQLVELVKQLPDGTKTVVGERGVRLSGGQRQRIGIARALYHEREILVLDEATAALDNETESLVSDAIKSLSGTKTMIIIAHRLTTVEHCDCIYLMEKGRIVKSGSYREVVLQTSISD